MFVLLFIFVSATLPRFGIRKCFFVANSPFHVANSLPPACAHFPRSDLPFDQFISIINGDFTAERIAMEYIPPKRKKADKQNTLNVMGGRALNQNDELKLIITDRRKYSSYDQTEMKRQNNTADKVQRIQNDVDMEYRRKAAAKRKAQAAAPPAGKHPRHGVEPDYIPAIKERRLQERMQDFYDQEEVSYSSYSEDYARQRKRRSYPEPVSRRRSSYDGYYDDAYYEDDSNYAADTWPAASKGRTTSMIALIIQGILSLALIIILITLNVFSFKLIAIASAVLIVLWLFVYISLRSYFRGRGKKKNRRR